MIEEGHVLGCPGLPLLSNETLVAAVDEAHRHNKLAIAHALAAAAGQQAIAAGVDGLAHVWIDRPDSELVSAIATSGAFVTPCLALNSSIMGNTGASFAADPRVASKLGPEWLQTLSKGTFNTFPQGNFGAVLTTVGALHKAGVDILAGTDVSVPMPSFGGLAHGASLHHECQLLVQSGMTPIEALKSATSVPARRFGLVDRGRVREGARADLLLVDGDPTTNISDTLNIKAVWRRGARLEM